MNHIYSMYDYLDEFCTNCGQQHFGGGYPSLEPTSYSPNPCIYCSQQYQNIFDDIPTKDHNDNMKYGGTEPFSRAYSLSPSAQSNPGYRSAFAQDVVSPKCAANDQRSYMLSNNSHPGSLLVQESPVISTVANCKSSVSTIGARNIKSYIVRSIHCSDGNILTNGEGQLSTSSESTLTKSEHRPTTELQSPSMITISRTSISDDVVSITPSEFNDFKPHNQSASTDYRCYHHHQDNVDRHFIDEPLQRQTSELAEMRRNQEYESVTNLRQQEPSSELKDQMAKLMVKHLEQQIVTQEKHQWELVDEEDIPVKEQRQCHGSEQTGWHGDGHNTRSPLYNRSISPGENITSEFPDLNGDGMSTRLRDAKKKKQPTASSKSITITTRSIIEESLYPHLTKSCPNIVTTTPYECYLMNESHLPNCCKEPACSLIDKSNPLSVNRETPSGSTQRNLKISTPSASFIAKPLSVYRNEALRKEIEQGQRRRQQIANAMVDWTNMYTVDVINRTQEDRENNALLSKNQRLRDADAAAYRAAIQIEKESIEATLLWIRNAKKCYEERKELEELAIQSAKEMEAKIKELKKREIELTAAAIDRQLADEEAAAVLRQMKSDELHLAWQRKQQLLAKKSKHDIAIADMVYTRKATEMQTQDMQNARIFEEGEAEKNRKVLEKSMQRQNHQDEADAASAERRRNELEADLDSYRQYVLKRSALIRELEEIRADNRRHIAEETSKNITTRRQNEDKIHEQQHKAYLSMLDKQRIAEEESLEALKKKFIEDANRERYTRVPENEKEILQAQAEVKRREAERRARESADKLAAEKLQNSIRLYSTTRTPAKEDNMESNWMLPSVPSVTPNYYILKKLQQEREAEIAVPFSPPKQIIQAEKSASKFNKWPPIVKKVSEASLGMIRSNYTKAQALAKKASEASLRAMRSITPSFTRKKLQQEREAEIAVPFSPPKQTIQAEKSASKFNKWPPTVKKVSEASVGTIQSNYTKVQALAKKLSEASLRIMRSNYSKAKALVKKASEASLRAMRSITPSFIRKKLQRERQPEIAGTSSPSKQTIQTVQSPSKSYNTRRIVKKQSDAPIRARHYTTPSYIRKEEKQEIQPENIASTSLPKQPIQKEKSGGTWGKGIVPSPSEIEEAQALAKKLSSRNESNRGMNRGQKPVQLTSEQLRRIRSRERK